MTHLYEKQRLIYSTRLLLVSIADKICCVGPNVFCFTYEAVQNGVLINIASSLV